jgi:hypothetical protein
MGPSMEDLVHWCRLKKSVSPVAVAVEEVPCRSTIRHIDGDINTLEDNQVLFYPLLKGIVFYLDMPRLRSWSASIGHNSKSSKVAVAPSLSLDRMVAASCGMSRSNKGVPR